MDPCVVGSSREGDGMVGSSKCMWSQSGRSWERRTRRLMSLSGRAQGRRMWCETIFFGTVVVVIAHCLVSVGRAIL